MRNRPGNQTGTFRVRVDYRLCLACGACVAVCPSDAIFLNKSTLMIFPDQCTDCMRCLQACPRTALSLHSEAAEIEL